MRSNSALVMVDVESILLLELNGCIFVRTKFQILLLECLGLSFACPSDCGLANHRLMGRSFDIPSLVAA